MNKEDLITQLESLRESTAHDVRGAFLKEWYSADTGKEFHKWMVGANNKVIRSIVKKFDDFIAKIKDTEYTDISVLQKEVERFKSSI